MEEKKDLRVIRTQKLLCEALIQLMQEESYDKISVSDICEKAMVHRATFYNHFNDKDSLLDFILDGLQEKLFETAKKSIDIDKITNEEEIYMCLVSHYLDFGIKNKDMLALILKNSKSKMTIIISDSLARYMRFIIGKNKYHNEYTLPIDIMIGFLTGGITAIGIQLLESKNPPTKNEIMDYFRTIINPRIYIKNYHEKNNL